MNDLLFERVFREAKWGMLLADEEGSIVLINKEGEGLLGLAQDDCKGKSINDVFQLAPDQDLEGDCKNVSCISCFNHKDLIVDASTFQDTKHRLFEIREGEESIKISADEKLQLATSAAHIGVWEYYPSTGVLVWNQDMFSVYDVNPSSFRGVYEDWANCLHPDDLAHAEQAVQIALETGENFDYNFRVLTQNKEIRHIKANAKVIHDDNGDPAGMLGTNIDITEEVSMRMRLEEQGANNRRFIEQSPHAIAMFNTEMQYLAASRVWIENNGLQEMDFLGKSHYEVMRQTSEKWRRIYEECLRGVEKQSDKDVLVDAKGNRKYIKWHIRPWYDHHKVVGGILVHVDDITEWVERMDEKLALEQVLSDMQSISRIGSWELNLKTNELHWDKVTREIHEVPDDFVPDVAKGINFYKEGFSRDAISAAVGTSMENGAPWDLSLQLVTHTNKEIWCRAIGQAEFNEEGECTRLYGLFQDIDRQKKAENLLKLSEVRFKQAFENSAIGMALVALTGEWLQVNNQLSEMLGYSEAELMELTFQDLTHPEDLDEDLQQLQRAIDGEISSYQMQKRYFHKDGGLIWAMMSVALIRDEQQMPVHLVAQIENITKRVENANKLQQANRQLEAIALKLSGQNKRLADFAHITSHNLRAPVANLSTLKQMHEMAESEEERQLIFSKFETVIDHLSSTLNELIEALIIKEKAEDQVTMVELSNVFEKISETLTGEVMTSAARLESDFSSFDRIEFNRAYMESIMLNLISNAIKYKAPDRYPRIKVFSEIQKGKKLLHFEDNGQGIDLKQHGKSIFGLHKTFHTHPEAKGVGLFLVKTQVEALGGKIRVDSEPGKGTRFTLAFAQESLAS